MQRLLIVVLCALLLPACQESRPANLLPHTRMVRILREFHLADAVSGQFSGIMESRDSLRRVVQLQVLQREKVTPQVFYQSYSWYLEHPEEMDSVYSDVLKGLNKELGH
jgi:uncharacterized protein YcfL